MAEKKPKSKERLEAEKSPVTWMAVYEAAKKRGDLALSNRAKENLRQLGVLVGHPEASR